ncbi:MAG: hypothetical protein E6J40_11585, partial [Chloroflexi bacterium]
MARGRSATSLAVRRSCFSLSICRRLEPHPRVRCLQQARIRVVIRVRGLGSCVPVSARVWAALAVVAVLGVAGCSSTQTAKRVPPGSRLTATPAPLATAIKQAAKVGPSGISTHVDLSLGLKVRNGDELARLMASGRTVTPAEYSSRFGPDPIKVQAALEILTAAGLEATWRPGSELIGAGGPAPVVAAVFAIDIEDYRLPGGATFYASVDTPKLAPVLAAVISSVNGLDSYRHERTYAVRPGGLTPTDVLAFYNLKPLREAGLDGTGITVVLPEIDDLP